MTEAEMNEKLAKESDTTVHWIEKVLVASAISQFGKSRTSINDILLDYAKTDGTISNSRVLSLLRKIDEVDAELRLTATSAVTDSIERTAARQAKTVVKILKELGYDIPYEDVYKTAVDYVQEGAFTDNRPLDVRVWNTSGAIMDKVRTEVRAGVSRKENVTEIMKRVKGVYDGNEWQVRRLVETESNVAQRKVTAQAAAVALAIWNAGSVQSITRKVVGVRITDHPGHKNHDKHRCYQLARIDRYGLGPGIYIPTDAEVYAPHPQCTSTLTYVLKDEVRRGA